MRKRNFPPIKMANYNPICGGHFVKVYTRHSLGVMTCLLMTLTLGDAARVSCLCYEQTFLSTGSAQLAHHSKLGGLENRFLQIRLMSCGIGPLNFGGLFQDQKGRNS